MSASPEISSDYLASLLLSIQEQEFEQSMAQEKARILAETKTPEERAHEQRIHKNYQEAMELIPESFVPVKMLYMDVQINGLHFKAFVDTGAQMTIMSKFLVEACGLTHLIDSEYQGLAKGVGQAKIVGRIYCADLHLGTQILPCSFTILDSQDMKLIFGLDMLKSHGCTLDLIRRRLVLANGEAVEFVEGDEEGI